jgi:hypothetical protein
MFAGRVSAGPVPQSLTAVVGPAFAAGTLAVAGASARTDVTTIPVLMSDAHRIARRRARLFLSDISFASPARSTNESDLLEAILTTRPRERN